MEWLDIIQRPIDQILVMLSKDQGHQMSKSQILFLWLTPFSIVAESRDKNYNVAYWFSKYFQLWLWPEDWQFQRQTEVKGQMGQVTMK